MDVGIGADPPLRAEIGVFGDFQVKLALFRPDVEPLPQRSEFKSLGSLHVDFAYRQLHLELAVHVGERFRAYADIRAIILKPAAIDLAAMPIGRDVPPLAGAERHPRRHRAAGSGVGDACMNPDLMALDQLHARRARAGRQVLPRGCLPEVEQVDLPGGFVVQRQRGIGVGGHLGIEVARLPHRFRGTSQSRTGRRQPCMRREVRKRVLARHDSQVHRDFPAAGLSGARLRKRDAVDGQALVAQRVFFPVKQCGPAKEQRVGGGRLHAQQPDGALGMWIGEGADPQQRRAAVFYHGRLQFPPILRAAQRAVQIDGPHLRVRHCQKRPQAPWGGGRADFQTTPDGELRFRAVRIHEDRFGQNLPGGRRQVCVARAVFPVAELGQADIAAATLHGNLDRRPGPRLRRRAQRHPAPRRGGLLAQQKRNTAKLLPAGECVKQPVRAERSGLLPRPEVRRRGVEMARQVERGKLAVVEGGRRRQALTQQAQRRGCTGCLQKRPAVHAVPSVNGAVYTALPLAGWPPVEHGITLRHDRTCPVGTPSLERSRKR